ncbi:MAG: hypothetical protein AUH85_03235 [Chloroflexi bacterium 13_1_40CM_4_68_4]|nr:MAG: hypothetical protein AUH85_03235 [Chloroflexi bacterium 13_1_40CM_4_68_4]
MSDDERLAWLSLALGIAAVALLGVALGLDLDGLIGVFGAAAGYAAWRVLPRRRPPPPKGYWRGRPYN